MWTNIIVVILSDGKYIFQLILDWRVAVAATESARAPRRPQQRALETRNALLETAVRSFSLVGYDGVSLRQLEQQAGVKRGLVAYHFGSKEQLWRTAVDQLFEALAGEFGSGLQVLADVAPVEAARGFIRALVRYSAAHPELNRLMMQESVAASWRVEYLVDRHIRPLLETLATLMPEAARLLWGEGDPHRYYLLIGASAFVFSAEEECRRLFGQSPRQAAFVERHAEMVVAMLVPG